MFERVLVTGGLGLIGSHLSEKLVGLCKEIVILDDASTGRLENISNIKSSQIRLIQGSVLDEELVNLAFEKVDFCFHLAASLGVKKILESPIESLNVNLEGSKNVFLAASNNKVPIFLASTSEIYGKSISQPLSESSDRLLGSPLSIRWAYSEAKAIDETMAQMYSYEYGLEFVIGRFFNTVGPRQLGDYGMVLPRFVNSAIKNEDLGVYGDGEQTRVFCHVKDAVEAVLKLVQNKGLYGDAFNIGGNREISIKGLAELVIQITGSKSNIKHVPYHEAYPRGFEEVYRRVPDTTKLKNATGWKAEISLEQTISDIAKSI